MFSRKAKEADMSHEEVIVSRYERAYKGRRRSLLACVGLSALTLAGAYLTIQTGNQAEGAHDRAEHAEPSPLTDLEEASADATDDIQKDMAGATVLIAGGAAAAAYSARRHKRMMEDLDRVAPQFPGFEGLSDEELFGQPDPDQLDQE